MASSLIGQHGARVRSHVVTVARSGPGNVTHQYQPMVVGSVLEQTKNTRTAKRTCVQDTSVTGLAGQCVVPAVVMEVNVNDSERAREDRPAMDLQEMWRCVKHSLVHVSRSTVLKYVK